MASGEGQSNGYEPVDPKTAVKPKLKTKYTGQKAPDARTQAAAWERRKDGQTHSRRVS